MRSDQCFRCRRLFRQVDGLRCLAFPDGIPPEILSGEVDHSEPHPGDNDYRFDPMSDEEAARIDKIMCGI